MGKVLGFGSYAVVRLSTHKVCKIKVAIKIYKKKDLEDPTKMQNVEREIKILSKLRHPNVIRLYQVLESAEKLHLIMEYLPNVSLSEYLN